MMPHRARRERRTGTHRCSKGAASRAGPPGVESLVLVGGFRPVADAHIGPERAPEEKLGRRMAGACASPPRQSREP